MSDSREPRNLKELYDRLAEEMVVLSFLWLVLFSSILPHHGSLELDYLDPLDMRILIGCLVLVWFLFAAEFAVYLVAIRRDDGSTRAMLRGIAVLICPILRMAISPFSRPGYLYLPFKGYEEKGRTLARRLEKAFGMPMILIVLLVLPVMAIELFREAWIQNYPAVNLAVSMASQLIWLAFAVEFAIMIAVTPKKMRYAIKHKLDLIIILLPIILMMLPVLFFLPVARLIRLGRIFRTARIVRMRGAGIRALRALTLLSVTKRFTKQYHDKMIARYHRKIEDLEEDIEDLREQIEELEEEKRELATMPDDDTPEIEDPEAGGRKPG